MALRTTVVGSWWPYEDSFDALRQYHLGQLGDEEGVNLLNELATRAISEQREIGFDEWTSGEYFCDSFIVHLRKNLTGIEIVKEPEEPEFDYDDLGECRIVGDIDAPNGLGYVEAFTRESQLPGGVKKATVVSPAEVGVVGASQPEELARQLPNLIRIVNEEIKGLAAAGCEHIQLDAPNYGVQINEGTLTVKQVADIIAACFEGVEGVTRGLHLCNGNNRGRPISSVLRNDTWVPLFQELDGVIDVANLEASYFAQYLRRDAFKHLPKSIELAAGIVDEANYFVEPVKKIKERAADWARVVGEERLWIQPSCGFGRHAGRDRVVLEPKVRNLIEAAASF